MVVGIRTGHARLRQIQRALLDDLISAYQQCLPKLQSKQLRRFQIDNKVKLSRLLHRQLAWHSAFDNFCNDRRSRPEELLQIWPICHETALFGESSKWRNRR